VATLAAAGIRAGVLLAPIVPGLTTDRAQLEAVVRAAADHGASFVGAGVLHLEEGVREPFEAFLRREAPPLLGLYRRLYAGSRVRSGVERALMDVVAELRVRHGLAERPPAASTGGGEQAATPGSQLSLGL
jgi:DNA repair photolyase